MAIYSSDPPDIEWHPTTYFEIEIPEVLEEELTALVVKRIKEFESICQCEGCKNEKLEQQNKDNGNR